MSEEFEKKNEEITNELDIKPEEVEGGIVEQTYFNKDSKELDKTKITNYHGIAAAILSVGSIAIGELFARLLTTILTIVKLDASAISSIPVIKLFFDGSTAPAIFSIIPAIVALALSIVALVQSKKKGGAGLSYFALFVSIAVIVVSIVSLVTMGIFNGK